MSVIKSDEFGVTWQSHIWLRMPLKRWEMSQPDGRLTSQMPFKPPYVIPHFDQKEALLY
jgi:hypothetical protein